jgi:hypothetical protein
LSRVESLSWWRGRNDRRKRKEKVSNSRARSNRTSRGRGGRGGKKGEGRRRGMATSPQRMRWNINHMYIHIK